MKKIIIMTLLLCSGFIYTMEDNSGDDSIYTVTIHEKKYHCRYYKLKGSTLDQFKEKVNFSLNNVEWIQIFFGLIVKSNKIILREPLDLNQQIEIVANWAVSPNALADIFNASGIPFKKKNKIKSNILYLVSGTLIATGAYVGWNAYNNLYSSNADRKKRGHRQLYCCLALIGLGTGIGIYAYRY